MSLLYVALEHAPARLRGLAFASSHIGPDQAAPRLADGQFRLAVLELPAHDPWLLPLCAAPRGRTALLVLGNADPVACLRAGADLCLPAEVTPRELRARLQALLRLQGQPPADETPWLSPGFPLMGLGTRQVSLTRDEQRLLEALARHGGVLPREKLEEWLWGETQEAGPHRLQRLVGGARRKLALLGLEDSLETLRGSGYRLTRPLLLRER